MKMEQPDAVAAEVRRRCAGSRPLKVCIEWLWARRLVEWPGHPASGTAETIACARFTMFIFQQTMIMKYGYRVHNNEKMGIVTRAVFEGLASTHWKRGELQSGVWVYYDTSTIRVHINDSKKIKKSAKKQRDVKSHQDNAYDAPIKSNNLFQPGFEWFEQMWPYVLWSYEILAPPNRFYTSNIWKTAEVAGETSRFLDDSLLFLFRTLLEVREGYG